MADTASPSLPAFAMALLGDADTALEILERVHPDYAAHRESWQILLDAFEGDGGFLSGDYLFEYAREDTADYNTRKHMARYHNYLESLVDLYVRFIWTQGVTRDSRNEDYNAWLENVDGQNTPIDDFLKQFASVALVHGHAGVLVDKTTELSTGQTKADEQAQVIATVFTALSMVDWRFSRSGLAAVKLLEAAPAVSLVEEDPSGDEAKQYLLWDREGWARFDAKGKLINGDALDLGLVPLVILRPKPSYLSRMRGRPLVSNGNVLKAMFNRASEEDEVIRAQAFSVLMVEVPPDGNVSEAKSDLGSVIGSSKAIVVRGKAQYQTPDQSVPGAIRDNIAYLVQEVYRAAHVKYRREAGQAESGESIRLQYTELNEMLQGFGKALAQAEQDIALRYFLWTSATVEQGQVAYDAAKVTVKYPDEFFLDDLMVDLEAWAEAIRMNLGDTMTKRIKKRAVRRIEPSLPIDEQEQIDKEIDAMKAEELQPDLVPLDRGDPEGAGIRSGAVN